MQTYFMDLETYSECPISKGTHAYASHPSARILLWAYAKDDGPVKVWDCDKESRMPEDLRQALDEIRSGEAEHVWHNGFMFDTVFLEYQGCSLPLENCIDTMVMAYQCGLPGSLEQLGSIFRLPEDKAKIKDGSRLIQKFCTAKYKGDVRNYRMTAKDAPEDWERFKDYCARDVDAMRTIYRKLPRFNCTEYEKALQLLDAKINRRGMFIDTLLAEKAIELAEENKARLDAETARLTNGEVGSATRTAALKSYIKDTFGVELESLSKGEVEKIIGDEQQPSLLRALLANRLRGAKTSIAKYRRALDAQVGSRLKGCLQFRGAMRTGRLSGRTFQPQNLSRPALSAPEIDAAIDAIKAGCADMFYDDYTTILADSLRGLIAAPEGKKLVVADYSNVEGRVLAWLAGEDWKLQAFRDFDAGRGHDLYKLTYGKTFGVNPEDVTKKQRQIGKVEELALGYGGGAGAFSQFALLYGIDLDAMSKEVRQVSDPDIWAESEEMYDWADEKKLTAGLTRSQWIACNTVKQAWRNANSRIVDFWLACEKAVRAAIEYPGARQFIREGMYALKNGPWLVLRLPSGRYLSYPSAAASEDGDITYYGVNQYSRKFEKIKTWGGKIVENASQAVACDLLLEAGLRLEAAGYEIVLSVHDEYICETPDDKKRNYRQMEQIMSELPNWAEGLPLTAAGFESYRYKKE